MQRAPYFSTPVYEGLPWVYIICGTAGLIGSYLFHTVRRDGMSMFVGVLSVILVIGGVMIVLRRRNYRAMRSQYADREPLPGNDRH